jgi:hypothetical protein
MEKEFITYEQALELKGLGFNEPCFGWFRSTLIPSNFTEYFLETEFGMNESPSDWVNSNFLDKACSAPLYQQAFRWFRDIHNLRGFIGFRPNVKQFDCHIYDMSLSGKEYVKQRTMEEFNKDPKVGTYEEAELECLKKLIEIVKKQKEDESNIIV